MKEVCPNTGKNGKEAAWKHQIDGAYEVKKHKNLQHVKEPLSVKSQ